MHDLIIDGWMDFFAVAQKKIWHMFPEMGAEERQWTSICTRYPIFAGGIVGVREL